jgi:hypothetical protein
MKKNWIKVLTDILIYIHSLSNMETGPSKSGTRTRKNELKALLKKQWPKLRRAMKARRIKVIDVWREYRGSGGGASYDVYWSTITGRSVNWAVVAHLEAWKKEKEIA